MGRGKKHRAESLAQAREAKNLKNLLRYLSQLSVGRVTSLDLDLKVTEPQFLDEDEVVECDWDGSVNHCLSSDSDWEDELDDTEFSELEGEDLKESLQKALEAELALLTQLTPYEVILQATSKEWKRAEQNRGLGYNG